MKLAWLGRLLLPVIVMIGIFTSFALAQDVVIANENSVTIPYGRWLDILLVNLADPSSVAWTVVAGIIAWLLAMLPGPAQVLFRTFRVEQLLNRAVLAGINATRGAVQDKALTVDVGSEVVAKAANYAIDHGSKHLIEWMGGVEGVQEKVLARVKLDASADGGTVIAKANSPETPQKITDPSPAK